jgi:hypothetical protein
VIGIDKTIAHSRIQLVTIQLLGMLIPQFVTISILIHMEWLQVIRTAQSTRCQRIQLM